MQELSLRDRKRQQTAHALARAAFDLTREHGLEGYTIDDIVGQVDVSRRTFANYFSCKEEAVTSLAIEQLRAGIASMPELPADIALLDWVKNLALHQLSGGMLDLLFQLRDFAAKDPALRPYLENVHAEIRRTAQQVVSERAGNSASKLMSHIIVGAASKGLYRFRDPLPKNSSKRSSRDSSPASEVHLLRCEHLRSC